MESIKFNIKSYQSVEFIIGDDPSFLWLTQFDAKSFNRFYVVIDNYIDEKWGSVIISRLQKQQKDIHLLRFEALEANKSLENFVQLVYKLEDSGLNRYDVIIAIGSGVLLDVVGFVASVYMRGIPLILVPTTLIGQVDAATAGKTCVNSPKSKNLIGTLYLPKYVYNNIRFLDTLSLYHFRQGVSEIFKYGLLGSARLLELLVQYKKEPADSILLEIIKETIRVRIALRKKDPLASNLGHTFGHAMEKLSNFSVGHGDSISIGILMALKYGECQGVTKPGIFETVREMMEQLQLNLYYDPEWTSNKIVDLMLRDKKSSHKKINLVLIEDIGKPYSQNSSPFYEAEEATVRHFLQYFFSSFLCFEKTNLAHFLRQ